MSIFDKPKLDTAYRRMLMARPLKSYYFPYVRAIKRLSSTLALPALALQLKNTSVSLLQIVFVFAQNCVLDNTDFYLRNFVLIFQTLTMEEMYRQIHNIFGIV